MLNEMKWNMNKMYLIYGRVCKKEREMFSL